MADVAKPAVPVVGDSDVIPPPSENLARTLVLCFDGTGNQFSQANSNVALLFSLLQKDDHTQQMVYYQSGLGTWSVPGLVTSIGNKVANLLDEAIAWNLDEHIMDGYTFLMQHYKMGDKICLFGFSRGAYTARCLAGMVQKVGLLPASNHRQVPFAYKMYTQDDKKGWEQSNNFKKAFSIDVDIDFVGVWDTVCSVGMIPRTLPFVKSNTAIRVFRHALALDERRVKFKANHWQQSTKKEDQLGLKLGEMPKSSTGEDGKAAVEAEVEKSPTDVLEVWFAGGHGDVGGTTVNNDTRHSLPRITLRWMIRQIFLANIGIRFHSSLFTSTLSMDWKSLYPKVQPRPALPKAYNSSVAYSSSSSPHTTTTPGPSQGAEGAFVSEELEDLYDAQCLSNDQLVVQPLWWILEVLPLWNQWQVPATPGTVPDEESEDGDGEDYVWVSQVEVNMGRPRRIPGSTKARPFHVHRSVKIRMGMGMDVNVPPPAESSTGSAFSLMSMSKSLLGKKKAPEYVPKAKWGGEPHWED